MGLSGLEPPTSPLSGVRSNQLSYRPVFKNKLCSIKQKTKALKAGDENRTRDNSLEGCGFTTKLHPQLASWRPRPDLNRRSPPWQGGVLTATLRGLYVVQLRGKDSNLRPPGYEPDELPTALPRDNKIGKTGFEPTTPWSQTKCSTKLSYFPQLWCICSTHPRGVEPLTAWFVVKYSIQLSYGCFIV